VAELIGRALATRTLQAGEITEPVPRERWFSLQVGPVPKPGGTPDFFLLAFMDMTQARRAEQMRSDFIANASHELRTPLASLRGFLETIKGPAANDKAATARFLDIMLEQSQRMSRLIDDLLSLSRIEMKAHVSPQGTVDIVSALSSVVASMQPLAEKLGVRIEHELPEGPVEIVGERDELIQVFDNLVENACKYGDSGKKVEVRAEMLEPLRAGLPRRIEVSVRDYGPGIDAEHLPRLTERFYRVNVSTSRDKQGTGLGLAIVKHILNRHGTRLQISSTPGKGARFSVIFPLNEAGAVVEE
jgi:two-component system phosphate regulon sensor histidine kinase PhoR